MTIFTERTVEKFHNGEFVDDGEILLNEDGSFLEASNVKSYYLRSTIYEKVEKVLDTPEGKRKFQRLVSDYINRNTTKLMTIGPIYRIPFTVLDKNNFWIMFGFKEREIEEPNGRVGHKGEVTDVIKTTTTAINDKTPWSLLRQNPIFVLFYFIIRYFTLKRDEKALNNALMITALAFYPSSFSKYLKYEVTHPEVMQYTIDSLSQRYIIKKNKHIYGTLWYSVQNSWKFHEKLFTDASDQEVIHFIQRIRNDQNSLIKKIANNYYDNLNKGLAVKTQIDSYDNGIAIDNENDSNRVENMTNKIVTNMLVNGVDYKLSDASANAANVSRIELRNYLTQISCEKQSEDMKLFIESILFIFLYDEKHTYDEINSKVFLAFAIALFNKANSKNSNIVNIKKTLDKWGTDSGIYGKFARLATRVDYTKGIFLYFIWSIQKYA